MHIVLIVARVLLVLLFVLSGANKLLDPQAAASQITPFLMVPDVLSDAVSKVQELSGKNLDFLLAIIIGVVEVLAALLVAFNIATRSAAFILALFTLVATYVVWSTGGDALQANLLVALKNLSIVGGLLTYVVLGSWRPVSSHEL
jgi:Predicted membrane protein